MPFLRFSRDKRGYEYFSLLQPAARGERAEPRVLYWFRSPPNIRVGREPFDPALRKTLEERNPDIEFNWDAITRTPIPPPSEADHWRERRRAVRAAKEAAASEAPGEIEAEAARSEGEPPTTE